MCDPNPELIYEEKIDNITLQLECPASDGIGVFPLMC